MFMRVRTSQRLFGSMLRPMNALPLLAARSKTGSAVRDAERRGSISVREARCFAEHLRGSSRERADEFGSTDQGSINNFAFLKS